MKFMLFRGTVVFFCDIYDGFVAKLFWLSSNERGKSGDWDIDGD